MKQDYLVELHNTTLQAISSLFGKKFVADKDDKEEALPSFLSPFLSQIGLCNPTYQLCILLGFDENAVTQTFSEVLVLAKDEDEQKELAKSTLGELANTVACDLAVKKIIREDFGQLLPTRPLIWETHGTLPDFWEAQGISGKINHNDITIYTHFSYLEQKNMRKDSLQKKWSPTRSLSIFDPHQR